MPVCKINFEMTAFNRIRVDEYCMRKIRNPKAWPWHHLAAASRTEGPAARRGLAVLAAAPRWRQSRALGLRSFPTPYLASLFFCFFFP